MNEAETVVRAAFARQAEACAGRGSPFMSQLCDALGQALDRSTKLGRRVLDWPGRPDARGDSVPLRLAGGLHTLVRQGRLAELAAFYPPHELPREAQALRDAISRALNRAEAELLPWLDTPPQTNEPMRSAPLMAGLLVMAAETGGLPLALYEVGASAGLNLVLDRYHHRLGATEAGDPTSLVLIAPAWKGTSPPGAPVRVLRRQGADLEPVDVTQSAHCERLLGYIWPDQADRLARIEAAIGIAAGDPPRIERVDGAEWTEREIDPVPEPGVARVLMHAVALQYAPENTVGRIAAHAARVGAGATREAPFAWLRFEADPAYDEQASLRLTLWPGGNEQVLAIGDTHAETLRWITIAFGRSGPAPARMSSQGHCSSG